MVHPRYQRWLAKCGITKAEAVFALQGEVVGGHANRHVRVVPLNSGNIERLAYLKREHRVGWRLRLKNRFAGFGSVSNSEREAMILGELEKAGLAAPQWLACGEDEAGRAFLLVEQIPDAMSLIEYLHEYQLDPFDKRTFCERLGRFLADFHNSGFSNPDLAAKHLLVQPRSQNLTLIDWTNAPMPSSKLGWSRCMKELSKLHATLPLSLFSSKDRLRVLWAYRRSRHFGEAQPQQRFARVVQQLRKHTTRLKSKSSIGLQQTLSEPQRLVWVMDDAVVTVPEVAQLWPNPAVCMPFYLPESVPFTAFETLVTPDGRRAKLLRYRTYDAIGRFVANLREIHWLAPACGQARTLLQLARHGVAAPKLLAFGQLLRTKSTADSFLLMTCSATDMDWFELKHQAGWCQQLGAYTRQLHDAGFLWKIDALSTCTQALTGDVSDVATLQITSPELLIRCKRRQRDQAERNLIEATLLLAPNARQLVLHGYHHVRITKHSEQEEVEA